LPTEVRIDGEGDARTAVEIATGKPAKIGSIEKMSKSKKNLVDPDDIIAHYGADCARWFVLSDSPPERDVIWTEAGVAGAGRFIQRIWRLVDQVADRTKGIDVCSPAPKDLDADALALRRVTHKTLDAVGSTIEGLRFNVGVAQIYTLANAVQDMAGKPAGPGRDWALREATDILVKLIAPMMPHLAEECGARLGYNTLVAETPWPKVDAALLVDDTVVLPVQVNGKRRDEITVPKAATEAEIEAIVRKLDAVAKAADGKPIKKIIVVPQRIVNVVV
ncbi:MAG: leucine tRNA synthetase, partial [Pseudomonadota bacterium]